MADAIGRALGPAAPSGRVPLRTVGRALTSPVGGVYDDHDAEDRALLARALTVLALRFETFGLELRDVPDSPGPGALVSVSRRPRRGCMMPRAWPACASREQLARWAIRAAAQAAAQDDLDTASRSRTSARITCDAEEVGDPADDDPDDEDLDPDDDPDDLDDLDDEEDEDDGRPARTRPGPRPVGTAADRARARAIVRAGLPPVRYGPGDTGPLPLRPVETVQLGGLRALSGCAKTDGIPCVQVSGGVYRCPKCGTATPVPEHHVGPRLTGCAGCWPGDVLCCHPAGARPPVPTRPRP